MKRYVPVPWPLIILKLQCRPGSKLSWLYAYLKSNVEKYVVSCDAVVFKFCWIVSINLSIFGTWYLFLWIDLFKILESKASLTVLSLFTKITIGEMKFLSEQLFNFMMCSSLCNFLSSSLTSGCKLMGTLHPFWCVGVKCLWNVDLTECFKDLPILLIRPGISNAICFLIKHWFWSTFAICFNWVREKPSFGKRSDDGSMTIFHHCRINTRSHPIVTLDSCINHSNDIDYIVREGF